MRWPEAAVAARPLAVWSLPALLVAGFVTVSFWGFSYDDAFITYRYAENLARHGALEYNLGERVLGTTAPLYAATLGALTWVTGVSIPGLATAIGVVSLLVTAGAIAIRLRSAAGSSTGVVIGCLIAVMGLTFRWNVEVLGSEFLPMVAFCTAAAAVATPAAPPWRDGLAGALAGLGSAMRLDAALFVLVAAVFLAWRRRRLPLRFLAVSGSLVSATVLATHAYFGRVVPNTLAAKRAERSLARFASYSEAEWHWLVRCLGLAAAASLMALALIGAVAAWRRCRSDRSLPWCSFAALLGLWVLGHELAYRWLGVPFAPWYQLPTISLVLALAACGLAAMFRWAPERAPRVRFLAPLVALALAAPLAVAAARFAVTTAGRAPDPRYAGYREVATAVRAARGEGGEPQGRGAVALTEIGVVGYFSRAPILDLMGLVDPAVLAARRRGALADYVAERRPCYLLDVGRFHPEHLAAILAQPEIAASYVARREFTDLSDPSIPMTLLADSSAQANC